MIVIIFGSTLTVILDEPGRSPEFKRLLEKIDVVFTVVFVIEMLAKVCQLRCAALWIFNQLVPSTYTDDCHGLRHWQDFIPTIEPLQQA